jgi:hypothetical protein
MLTQWTHRYSYTIKTDNYIEPIGRTRTGSVQVDRAYTPDEVLALVVSMANLSMVNPVLTACALVETCERRYNVEINGEKVLRTDNLGSVREYVKAAGLMSATDIDNTPQFAHVALSADGDIICGFIFNNKVER